MARLLLILQFFLLLRGTTAAPRQATGLVHGPLPFLGGMVSPLDVEAHTPAGTLVIDDMVLYPSLYQTYFEFPSNSLRKGAISSDFLWPKENGVPTVPYKNQNSMYKEIIEDGMKHWEQHTCLNFRPKKENDTNWVRFILGDGCYSVVGKISGHGEQDISIGGNCDFVRIVIHEVGHAIGLWHEHMRADRDEHVVINWQNIISKQISNFQKKVDDPRGVPYDYTSIMHYTERAFTSNGKLTVATRNHDHQGLLGDAKELSHRDKHLVNLMYGCLDLWSSQCSESIECEGEGYLGRNCTCVCPPGREGDRCENQIAGYYSDSLPACSQTITTKTKFSSPNYPEKVSKGTWCMFTVEAEEGMVPEVIFHSFSLLPFIFYDKCSDFLEIRDKSLYEGNIYCGTSIKRGQSFVSNSRRMYLYMNIHTDESIGFEAEVVFRNASDVDSGSARGVAASCMVVIGTLFLIKALNVRLL